MVSTRSSRRKKDKENLRDGLMRAYTLILLFGKLRTQKELSDAVKEENRDARYNNFIKLERKNVTIEVDKLALEQQNENIEA
jgi:hypothetical protein